MQDAARNRDMAAGYSNKNLLTAAIMLATIMQTVDTTIANVALPYIQSALSATQDEVAWVLTSYIIAAAVMFPLSGWLANAYGRRGIFLISVAVFIHRLDVVRHRHHACPNWCCSGCCKASPARRLLPLSQAILFEINEPKDYGRAMSIFGLGITLGPILGPTLGGYLTDHYSWRWVFYVNLPIGALAFAALYLTLPRTRPPAPKKFDFFGFATLSVAVAALQLMLDRGKLLVGSRPARS